MGPRRLGYRWHLRVLMAQQSMFATSDLQPLLSDRGVVLSAAQIYRLVAQTPERLSLRTLMALCDILGCTPNDLIEPAAETKAKATGTGVTVAMEPSSRPRPRRADIT
jgi:DNA-binding Xre family transcriptional regulator